MADTTPHNAPIITEHSEAEKNRRGLLFRFSKGLLIAFLALIGTVTFSTVLVLELKPVRQFVLGSGVGPAQ
jgi:cell division septal protein FtsQ